MHVLSSGCGSMFIVEVSAAFISFIMSVDGLKSHKMLRTLFSVKTIIQFSEKGTYLITQKDVFSVFRTFVVFCLSSDIFFANYFLFEEL